MNTPLATVIVPVKNMSGSMTNMSTWLQQVENFSIEIIFVNDNSTDNTFTELTELKKQFDRLSIQVVSGEFYGPGGARNAGLSLAQGQWVVFWDSDDAPYPNVFFEMIKSATTKNLDYAVGNWIESPNTNSKGTTLRSSAHGTELRELIKYPGIWRWAFKRSAIGNTRFPSIFLGEDLVFLSKLQIKFSKVYRYSEPVYAYSTGNDSQLTSENSIQKNSDALLQYLKSKDFLYGKITFFGALLKAKLLVSTINRTVKPRARKK
jgi:glycosyltransferase involved in cell wall biosynthesis